MRNENINKEKDRLIREFKFKKQLNVLLYSTVEPISNFDLTILKFRKFEGRSWRRNNKLQTEFLSMNRTKRTVSKKNKFEEGRRLLHPSNLAATLPCREKEYDDIFNFVKNSLLQQVGG